VYLEPWHADIFEFLDLRKNHGKVKSLLLLCKVQLPFAYENCKPLVSCSNCGTKLTLYVLTAILIPSHKNVS
jgi:hypothetical protein